MVYKWESRLQMNLLFFCCFYWSWNDNESLHSSHALSSPSCIGWPGGPDTASSLERTSQVLRAPLTRWTLTSALSLIAYQNPLGRESLCGSVVWLVQAHSRSLRRSRTLNRTSCRRSPSGEESATLMLCCCWLLTCSSGDTLPNVQVSWNLELVVVFINSLF